MADSHRFSSRFWVRTFVCLTSKHAGGGAHHKFRIPSIGSFPCELGDRVVAAPIPDGRRLTIDSEADFLDLKRKSL